MTDPRWSHYARRALEEDRADDDATTALLGPDRERPAQGGFDEDFELERRTGEFTGRVPLPLAGRWRLVATAQVGDSSLRRVFSLESGAAAVASGTGD